MFILLSMMPLLLLVLTLALLLYTRVYTRTHAPARGAKRAIPMPYGAQANCFDGAVHVS